MKMKTFALVSLGLACQLGGAAVAADPAPKPAAPVPVAAPAAKAAAPAPAAAAPAAAPAPSPEAVEAGKKIDWAKMDQKAKKAYMKKTVLPTMKKLFVAFNKKNYSAMTCATCHGKKAVDSNNLKMPNADLPKLPGPTDRAGFMALAEKKPEAAKFMGTQVKPTMAALLGKPEWQPTNPEGFGCYACHTSEAAAAAPPPAGAAPAAPAPKPGPAAPAPKPGPAPAPAAPPKGGGW
jgi:hypothetical protein